MLRPGNRSATVRLVPVVRRRWGLGGTTAGGGPSGCRSARSLRSFCHGCCATGALPAGGGLPIIHPFALPGKRFVKEQVLEKSKAYLGTETSYRQTVRCQARSILYEDPARDPPAALAPSTVWRWLSWLGGLSRTRRGACDLIRQQAPNATLHREPCALPAGKYRSVKRRRILQQALQLLAADGLIQHLFGKEIFPSLATAHGWS